MLFYLFLTIWHFYSDSHYLVNGTFLSIAFLFCELESLSKQDKTVADPHFKEHLNFERKIVKLLLRKIKEKWSEYKTK